MRQGLLVSFIAAIGLITWDELKNRQRVPHPERYVSAVIVWFILGLVAELGAPELAGLFGIGLVLTLYYSYYNNGNIYLGGEGLGAVGAGSAAIAGGVGGQTAPSATNATGAAGAAAGTAAK
jgi:hypothetical protein